MFQSGYIRFFIVFAAVTLTGCEATKEELGLTRRTPDEFAVVERAPLEMPPDYYLRPPTPGVSRPQEQAPATTAETALLGKTGTVKKVKGQSKSEISLLQKTQASSADPKIRQILDVETKELAEEDKPTIQRLLDLGGKSDGVAQVVDAPAEAARLKDNKKSGKTITERQTPSIKK